MNVRNLVSETGRLWSGCNVLQLAAALAYYSIFSLAPLLVVVIAVVGWIFEPEAVRGQLDDQLRGSIGQSGAEIVQSMVQSTYKPGQGVWASIIGLATLLLGASGVFSQLKRALNAIWSAPPQPGSGIVAFLRARLASFGMVLVIGFLMLASLLLTTVVAATWDVLSAYLPFSKFLLSLAGFAISASLATTLFAFIFKALPDVSVSWRHAWVGAAFAAVLFEIGKLLLGMYLGRESTASGYGAAGAVVLVLLWIYYTAVILLTGACFTRAYEQQSVGKK